MKGSLFVLRTIDLVGREHYTPHFRKWRMRYITWLYIVPDNTFSCMREESAFPFTRMAIIACHYQYPWPLSELQMRHSIFNDTVGIVVGTFQELPKNKHKSNGSGSCVHQRYGVEPQYNVQGLDRQCPWLYIQEVRRDLHKERFETLISYSISCTDHWRSENIQWHIRFRTALLRSRVPWRLNTFISSLREAHNTHVHWVAKLPLFEIMLDRTLTSPVIVRASLILSEVEDINSAVEIQIWQNHLETELDPMNSDKFWQRQKR